jgi:hypothetical protein
MHTTKWRGTCFLSRRLSVITDKLEIAGYLSRVLVVRDCLRYTVPILAGDAGWFSIDRDRSTDSVNSAKRGSCSGRIMSARSLILIVMSMASLSYFLMSCKLYVTPVYGAKLVFLLVSRDRFCPCNIKITRKA